MNFKTIAFAAALFAAPSTALAVPLTYTVNGTFTDPAQGGFSGTFVYDAGINVFSAINLSSTAGPGFTAASYNASIIPDVANTVRVTENGGAPLGARCLVLVLSGAMTNAGPALTVTQSFEGTAGNAGCTALTPARLGTTGTVTAVAPAPVPTLNEWAMVLMGLLLAGGAAVMIQRRRLAA